MKRLYTLFIIIAIAYFNCLAQGDTVYILNVNPTTDDSIKVVSSKCEYDFTSYEFHNDTIVFKVRTNSMVDMACIVIDDTVNIGTLSQGTWTLQYYYIDDAPIVLDTVLFSKTITFEVSGTVKISTQSKDPEWIIFPNPAKEYFLVENEDFSLSGTNMYLTIMDINRKILIRKNLVYPNYMVDISELPGGCYILRLVGRHEVHEQILLKY